MDKFMLAHFMDKFMLAHFMDKFTPARFMAKFMLAHFLAKRGKHLQEPADSFELPSAHVPTMLVVKYSWVWSCKTPTKEKIIQLYQIPFLNSFCPEVHTSTKTVPLYVLPIVLKIQSNYMRITIVKLWSISTKQSWDMFSALAYNYLHWHQLILLKCLPSLQSMCTSI